MPAFRWSRRKWEAIGSLFDAEGHRELAANAARKAEEVEAQSKDAAEKVANAKDRLARLAKGEVIGGGLGKPKELTKQDFLDAGFTEAELRHCKDVADFGTVLGKGAIKWLADRSVEASERWQRKTIRKILAAR